MLGMLPRGALLLRVTKAQETTGQLSVCLSICKFSTRLNSTDSFLPYIPACRLPVDNYRDDQPR